MNPIIIVLDCSGSMGEMSKILLAHNLIDVIREYPEIEGDENYFNNIYLYLWNDTINIKKLDLNTKLSYTPASGSASLKQLINSLELLEKKEIKEKVIILSDGSFSESTNNDFNSWNDAISHLCIRVVSIGEDADMDQLIRLSSNSQVYLPQDILVAIESLIIGNDSEILMPHSLSDISIIENQDDEEDWE